MEFSNFSPGAKGAMNTAIQEALTCTTCSIDPLEAISGLDRGRDRDDQGISFATHKRGWREESPLGTAAAAPHAEAISFSTPPTTDIMSCYEPLMTPSQKEFYDDLLDRFTSQDPQRDVNLARYLVNYHIHVHYMFHRGVISLCRDGRDKDELKSWTWGMTRLNDDELKSRAGCSNEELIPMTGEWEVQLPDFSVPKGDPWPENAAFMKHVEDLWQQRYPLRQRRLGESRMKWKRIMAERERQRELELAQLQLAQRKTIVKTVRIYWGQGIVREVALDSPWVT
ncbi:hypothetical protein BDV23DRAFT_187906 [Aspergillus alliaceus]|uniref:Uncharacterized protein n=1 Tax=Petromyces alliaceus TaxID=209559 RepID=A0A5N7BVG6_PETAA|nr:hypothetical protein BDV23DRAFT_187906 [Aspergillus alliaceus]